MAEKLTTDELVGWFHSAGAAFEAVRAISMEAEAQKKRADVAEERLKKAMEREEQYKADAETNHKNYKDELAACRAEVEDMNRQLREAKDAARFAEKAREDAERRMEEMDSHPDVRAARAEKLRAESKRLAAMAEQMDAPKMGAKK